jgi:hypothetical protein
MGCLKRVSFGALTLFLLEGVSGVREHAVAQTSGGAARRGNRTALRLRQVAQHKHLAGHSSMFAPLPVDREVITATRGRIHNKLAMAQAQVYGVCHGEDRQPMQPCRRVLDLIAILLDASTGVEPSWGFLAHVRFLLGLNFWLNNPGPTTGFSVVDTDSSGSITYPEFQVAFGQAGSMLPIFELMDSNGDLTISKIELVDYLRTAVNIRELVPDVDEFNPGASSETLMSQIDLILSGGPKTTSHTDGGRLSLVKCIVVLTLVAVIGGLYLFCVRGGSTPAGQNEKGKAKAEKEGKNSKNVNKRGDSAPVINS